MTQTASERLPVLGATPEEAQAYLAAIVNSSEDAIVAKALDGTITFGNPSAQRLYGWTANEAIGRPISLIISPDRPTEMEDILGRTRRGETVEHFQTRRVAKDGHRVDVSVSVSPIRDASGRIIGAASITRDISERVRYEAAHKKGEQELKFERDRLRHILDLLPEAVIVEDANARVVIANRGTCAIMGRDMLRTTVPFGPEAPFGQRRADHTPYPATSSRFSDRSGPDRRRLAKGASSTTRRPSASSSSSRTFTSRPTG